MPFELYTPKRRGRTWQPSIRLNRKSSRMTITMSAKALLPKACTHILIAYDREERRVALIATAPNDPKAIKLTGSSATQISAGRFIEEMNLADGTYVLVPTRIRDTAALVVDKAIPLASETKP